MISQTSTDPVTERSAAEDPTNENCVTAHASVPKWTHTKLCPSCGTRCFFDAARCYECLYEFDVPISNGSNSNSSSNSSNNNNSNSNSNNNGGLLQEFVVQRNKDAELVAVGVVVVEKESAPESALEITMKFNESYASRLAKSFSACS